MHVVATAGHVDHGKTSLVDALTGMRSDRLPEEQARSMSIELGYVWTRWPGLGDVAFVDVPGHERFIGTALAGLGQASSVLLVVAADDPWMPQAEEHLAALDALGYTHGVVAITRCDLAAPAAIRAVVSKRLESTSLAESPIVEVSVREGIGLEDLRRALSSTLDSIPVAEAGADVRVWLDRRFTLRGKGSVVTGTMAAGTITAGDRLTDGNSIVRVRDVHALGRPQTSVRGPARVALNLGGKAPAAITRGRALLTPNAWRNVYSVDVRLQVAVARLPMEPILHIGSASTSVRTRSLGEAFVRLRLAEPLPLRVGDRGLLRDPGQRRVWGFHVLDPAPPPLVRRGAARERAEQLTSTPLEPSLDSELRRRGHVHVDLMRQLGVDTTHLPTGAVRVGPHLAGVAYLDSIRIRLTDLARKAEAAGAPVSVDSATRSLRLPDPGFILAVSQPPLHVIDGRVRYGGDSVSADLQDMIQRLAELVGSHPFVTPTSAQLRDVGLDQGYLRFAIQASLLIELEGGMLLRAEALSYAAQRLRDLAQPFSVSQARLKLETSRKTTLAILGHLEAEGSILRLANNTRTMVDAPSSQ